MRKAAERTLEATWRRSGIPLDQFPPKECGNYLVSCGYAAIPEDPVQLELITL